jgi:hypothetical protein
MPIEQVRWIVDDADAGRGDGGLGLGGGAERPVTLTLRPAFKLFGELPLDHFVFDE